MLFFLYPFEEKMNNSYSKDNDLLLLPSKSLVVVEFSYIEIIHGSLTMKILNLTLYFLVSQTDLSEPFSTFYAESECFFWMFLSNSF